MIMMPACFVRRQLGTTLFKRRTFTWMMKIVIGSFGLYLDGLPPSRMPPCDAARKDAEVAAGFAEAVWVTMLAMIVPSQFVTL